MSVGLQRKEDTQVKTAVGTKGVDSMLDLYQRSRNIRRSGGEDYEQGWKDLSEIYVDIFRTTRSAVFQVSSKLLYQVLNKISKAIKRPSRRFLSDKGDIGEVADKEIEEADKEKSMIKEKEQVAKDTVDTIQELGGLNEVLTKDFGAFKRFLFFGDTFIHLGFGDQEQPIKYEVAPLFNVYVDPFALDIRRKNGVSEAGELLFIQEVSYDVAKQMFPNAKFMSGRLPVSREQFEEITKDKQQEIEQEDRVTEIGHYYNIQAEKPFYSIYIGSSATEVQKAEGDKYPFINLSDKPFIPVIPLHALPSPRGFYNYGLGHLLFDFHRLQEEIVNQSLNYVKDQYNPLIVANIQGEAETFHNQALLAREAQELGEKGYIVNTIREGQSTSGGTFQTLKVDPLTNEFERILNWITTEVKRCDIPIDDIDRPSSQKATTVVAEEFSKQAFIEDIIENNITNFQELDELTMAMLKTGDFLKSKIKIPTKTVGVEGSIELGDFVEDLQETRYYVDVESRTGAWKTPAFQVAANNESISNLELLPQGSEAQKKVIVEFFRNRGMDIAMEDLAQETPQEGVQEGKAPPPAGTSLQSQVKDLTQKNAPTV